MSLHCDGSTQLRGFRNNEAFSPACVTKKTSSGSSCVFDKVYQGDSGEYWCEAKGGESSNTINITVTGMCITAGLYCKSICFHSLIHLYIYNLFICEKNIDLHSLSSHW